MNAMNFPSENENRDFNYVEYIRSMGQLSIIRANGTREIKFCIDRDMSEVVVTRGVTKQGDEVITFTAGLFKRSVVGSKNEPLSHHWEIITKMILNHEIKDSNEFELKVTATAVATIAFFVFSILITATIFTPHKVVPPDTLIEIANSKAVSDILREIHVID